MIDSADECEAQATRLADALATLGRHNSLRDPFLAKVEAQGMTPSQLHSLVWIGTDKALSMKVLAQRVGVTEKTITGVVDRLERDGLVQRVREPSDRRVVLVELTKEGQRTYRELDRSIRDQFKAFLGLLDAEDRQALFTILDKLIVRASEAAAEAP